MTQTEPNRIAFKSAYSASQGVRLRALFRESDVCEIVASIGEIRQQLRELQSFLQTFQVHDQEPKPNTKWRTSTGIVPHCVQRRAMQVQ
ncbi:hypothetical protein JG687_00004041 [Phytophthora cactorum]|uniref:Uncharacterized protein n=1 Tax=Phytophthora cactorum TaxID=29920 RepID=A0A8T1UQC2_9STRA|nr:hypothetical protein JG687_00004041 [Phytophthora cactorum]